MPKLWRKRILLSKVESTYGTDAIPAATDAVLARQLELEVQADIIDRELVRPSLGRLPALSANRRCVVRAEVEIAGSGAAGAAPAWGKLLRGCGLAEIITADMQASYNPASDNLESLTLYWYADGLVHKVTGARGTFRASITAGEVPRFSFEFTGFYQDPADEALPARDFSAWRTPVIPSKVGMPTFRVHGVNLVGQSFEFDCGNTVVFRDLMNASDVLIIDRDPRATVVAEALPAATKNWHQVAASGTTGSYGMVIGSSAGSIVDFSGFHAQVRNVGYRELDGVIFTTLELGIADQAEDDAFTIVAR